MGAMKQMLVEEMEARMSALAVKSGYELEELWEHYFAYVEECQEDGEPIDWRYFEVVSTEQDW